MGTSWRMAAMSHLSDAQELIAMGFTSEENRQLINNHINFAKSIIMKKIDRDDETTDEELNELWTKVCNRFKI